jgi:hypothetical protein
VLFFHDLIIQSWLFIKMTCETLVNPFQGVYFEIFTKGLWDLLTVSVYLLNFTSDYLRLWCFVDQWKGIP